MVTLYVLEGWTHYIKQFYDIGLNHENLSIIFRIIVGVLSGFIADNISLMIYWLYFKYISYLRYIFVQIIYTIMTILLGIIVFRES